MYNEGVYTMIENGETDMMGPDHWFFQYLYRYAPQEDDPGYKKWLDRWSIIYNYNIDPEKVGDDECVYTIVNYIKNNAIWGDDDPTFSKIGALFGEFDNNKFFTADQNPFFANPTLGDYTVIDGAGVIADEFRVDFSKIGIEK